MKEHFQKSPATVLADTGFCNEKAGAADRHAEHHPGDLEALEDRGVDGYVSLGREDKQSANVAPAKARMQEKLATEEVRGQYRQRKWLSEAPNGWIKEALGFRRFSLRGLEKARAEWDLVFLALNLKRLNGFLAA